MKVNVWRRFQQSDSWNLQKRLIDSGAAACHIRSNRNFIPTGRLS